MHERGSRSGRQPSFLECTYAFDTIRTRLMNEGASDGTINDFGSAHSVFFRDPDGLEGEVLLTKP